MLQDITAEICLIVLAWGMISYNTYTQIFSWSPSSRDGAAFWLGNWKLLMRNWRPALPWTPHETRVGFKHTPYIPSLYKFAVCGGKTVLPGKDLKIAAVLEFVWTCPWRWPWLWDWADIFQSRFLIFMKMILKRFDRTYCFVKNIKWCDIWKIKYTLGFRSL